MTDAPAGAMAAAPTDMELAALISSKICHDVIGPVGAIYNGLEILGEEGGHDAKSYALEVIRNVTEQASNRLQFARFAFGAAGSAGAQIDLDTARKLAEGFVAKGKHQLAWRGPMGTLPKDRVKLLLNLIASAISALPRGGEIQTFIGEDLSRPEYVLRCRGKGARVPNYLGDLVAGHGIPEIDSMSIQAYYTWRLAATSGMQITILKEDDDVLLHACVRD